MIITIDGPSGTGKSTVAKGVAKKLGFTFFDTGAMYRSLAWWLSQSGVDISEEKNITPHLDNFRYKIQGTGSNRKYFVHGTEVTGEIRTQEISTLASKIAVYPTVRHALVKIQREFGRKTNAVFEGRDMGTVVFPDAELKIFLTASAEVRAQRRFLELNGKYSFEQILKETEERDRNDSTRKISPLKKADGAILIDTSKINAEQVIEKILEQCHHKMNFLYAFIRFLTGIYVRVFYRLKVYGLENFKPGPAIIAPNHASLLDPPIVYISCPEAIHSLGKKSLFEVPILRTCIRFYNCHPVSRSVSDTATFRLILSLLSQGDKVLLFPEGNRTPDGQLQSIERGLAFLAIKARCRIQPVYLGGTFEAWNRHHPFPKLFGRITCVFGTPIEWEDFEGLDRDTAESLISSRINTALHALENWSKAGAIGTPP